MAPRRKGTLDLQENIETGKQMPLDARQLVRTKEEMLTEGSFEYGYKGLFTAERTEGKIWMLMDQNNPTLEESWKVIGPYDDGPIDARVTALENASPGAPTWDSISGKPDFANVATSGSYNDLGDKPTIPEAYDDTEVRNLIAAKANSADLAPVATSGSYNDLGDKPTIPEAYDDTEVRNLIAAKANSADLATVATSGSYNDLGDKPTIPAEVTVDDAMSDSSTNPVQNKVVLAAIGDAIDVVEANVYTKAETDAKIAEAMVDVDNEHFHPVTALPDPAAAKENHEYVLITYGPDGTTIESETHYLFYGGVFHEKQTQVSLDGYATEAYVDTATGALDTRVTTLENAGYLTTETQADWNESDNTSAAYIANKPNIPTFSSSTIAVTDVEGDGSLWDIGVYDTLEIVPYSGDAEFKIILNSNDGNITLRKFGDNPTAIVISPEYITGLSNTTWDSNNPVSGRAATEDQLSIVAAGLELTALTDEEIAALVPA